MHVFILLLDFDSDDMISSNDLREMINRLTGEEELSETDMNQLIENVSLLVLQILKVCLPCTSE